jgi:hypothetical protein
MATITYKSLTALQPVELHYNFYTDESLTKSVEGYEEGYNFSTIEGLNNFQDIAINKNTCFILTSAVLLSSIFTKQKEIQTGQIPATINLQLLNSTTYYLGYNINEDSVISTYTTPQNFFIIPVNDQEVEIKVGNFNLEVSDTYPHKVYASNLILTSDQIRRRRFKYQYQNNQIALIAQTQYGDRYLALGNDNILRATGIVLGNNLVNNYLFKVINVTTESINYNFKPDNTWTTYFFDFANQTNNTDISINREVNNIHTNFLLSFSVGKPTNHASVNIANLKTGLTPTGCTATINNSYEEEIITTN